MSATCNGYSPIPPEVLGACNDGAELASTGGQFFAVLVGGVALLGIGLILNKIEKSKGEEA